MKKNSTEKNSTEKNSTEKKENGTAKKEKITEKNKKSNKIANVLVGSRKHFTHKDIVTALRECDVTEKALLDMALTFNVVVNKGVFCKASNPGLLKMRAANVIRGALSRSGLFDGEITQIPPEKKSEKKASR